MFKHCTFVCLAIGLLLTGCTDSAVKEVAAEAESISAEYAAVLESVKSKDDIAAAKARLDAAGARMEKLGVRLGQMSAEQKKSASDIAAKTSKGNMERIQKETVRIMDKLPNDVMFKLELPLRNMGATKPI